MKTYSDCLQKLKESHEYLQEDGLAIGLKPIPDCDEMGVLDGRLLADYLQNGGVVYPANFSALTPEDIALVRRQMGTPSEDLSHGVSAQQFSVGQKEIPLFVYRPDSAAPHALVFYIHGGGFLGGCARMDENVCKLIAEKANAVVATPDYSLAPEHPFPCALDECREALSWVCRHASEWHADPGRLIISGDSSGGNLALACSQKDRDEGLHRIKGQMLLYPCLNPGKIPIDGKTWDENRYAVCSHEKELREIIHDVGIFNDLIAKTYVSKPEDLHNSYVTPLLGPFKDLPRTLVVTAEFDYLRLEGEMLTRKLLEAGVSAKNIRYLGMCHAFVEHLGSYPQAEDCIAELADFVNNP